MEHTLGLRRLLATSFAGALALAGCATQVAVPALPDYHPASPAAASAERARPSGVLGTDQPAPAADDHPPAHAESHSSDGPHQHQAVAEPEPGMVYACPIHPEQTSSEPAACPICGTACEPMGGDDAGHGGHESHEGHGEEHR